jgi:hypothetical protein
MRKIIKTMLVCAIFAYISCVCFSASESSDNLVKKAGKYIKNMEINEKILAEKKYNVILLSNIDISKISDKKNVTTEICKNDLRQGIMNEARNTDSPTFVFDDSAKAQARLDLAIIEMNPGSKFQRFLAGEIGVGSAIVKVEGKLTDTHTNDIILQFSVKRGATGSWQFRNSVPGSDSGPGLISDIIDRISNDIVNELQLTVGGK